VSRLSAEWQDRAALAVTKAEQVNFMILAMRRGIYQRGHTTLAMAKLWALDEGTVEAREVEAVRAVQRIIEEQPGDLLAELVLRVHGIGQDALERTEEYVDRFGHVHTLRKPDHRSALQAAMDVAELAGLRKQRIEVDVRTLSDEQITEQLRAHGVEVRVIETTAEPAGPVPSEGEAP
jgi:hypothetical protein